MKNKTYEYEIILYEHIKNTCCCEYFTKKYKMNIHLYLYTSDDNEHNKTYPYKPVCIYFS